MLLVVAAITFFSKFYRKFYCKFYCTCDRSIIWIQLQTVGVQFATALKHSLKFVRNANASTLDGWQAPYVYTYRVPYRRRTNAVIIRIIVTSATRSAACKIKQEQQRVDARLGNAQCMSIRQVSLRRGTCGHGSVTAAAAASAMRQFSD